VGRYRQMFRCVRDVVLRHDLPESLATQSDRRRHRDDT
jgi:hypothetical protein